MSATHIELRFGPDNKYVVQLAVTDENRESMLAQLRDAVDQLTAPTAKKKMCAGQKMLSFCAK